MNEQQRHNTETYLVPVLEAKIAKNEPEEVLNSFLQPCETHGCVAGDVGIKMFYDHVDLGALDLSSYDPCRFTPIDIAVRTVYAHFEELIGFTEYFNYDEFDIFGSSENGTLQDRLDYVNSRLEANS